MEQLTQTNLTWEDCKKACSNFDSLSTLKNQSILITGGTGFVGKWITEMVLYLNSVHLFNIQLYILARNITTYTDEVPHLANDKNVTLLTQDIRNLHIISDNVSWVIHAAGSPDNREHASQPLKTIDTFYNGTNALLDSCSRLPNLKKIIHISSHLVYGNQINNNILSEQYLGTSDCNSINSAYSEAKRIAETLCAIYRNQQKLPITIVRPFSFVGPYQSIEKPWAINNFIRDGLLGSPIRILGNLQTTRSYLYGSDMAYWLLSILANGKVGATYDIGSSNTITLLDLASKIASLIDNKLEIVTKSAKENYSQVSASVPNISALTQNMQLKETYTLDAALIRTIEWNKLHKKNIK